MTDMHFFSIIYTLDKKYLQFHILLDLSDLKKYPPTIYRLDEIFEIYKDVDMFS